jgi:hypothetical protein
MCHKSNILKDSENKFRMVSSGMLRHVVPVRIDVIRVTKICELGTTLAVTSNRRTLRKNTNLKSQNQI